MSQPTKDLFKWRRYRGPLILLSVRWYLAFTLSYRQLESMLREQGWTVDHTSVFRWVQRYGPELAVRCRAFLKPTNRSYRTDETYIKVKGKDRYLYRAVDSTGQTIDFLLTAKRDKAAAKRFFQKALRGAGNPPPRVINVDKNAAYPAAFKELKAEGFLSRRCRLRQCKFLNNVVEQDHRVLNRRVRLAIGYGSFRTAWRTIQGIEAMHMIRRPSPARVKRECCGVGPLYSPAVWSGWRTQFTVEILTLESLQHCPVQLVGQLVSEIVKCRNGTGPAAVWSKGTLPGTGLTVHNDL